MTKNFKLEYFDMWMMVNHLLIGLTGNYLYRYKYSSKWDSLLSDIIRDALDGECEYTVETHEVSFGRDGKTIHVWKEDKQYSYGNLYRVDGAYHKGKDVRPSIWTMMMLNYLVNKDEVDFSELENF